MSSYRGHFHTLSPSDQADIASWREPMPRDPFDGIECAYCGHDIKAGEDGRFWCSACEEYSL